MIAPFRMAALLCILATGFGLGIALASEDWGGLVPCALCLLERWPYRVALGLGCIALVLPPRFARPMLLGVLLAGVAAAALAGVHVGVERGVWPSPLPECTAPAFHGGSIAERLADMPAFPAKPCDDPTYLIPFLPLSMAAMNLLYALAFTLPLAIFLVRNRRRPG